MTKPIDEPRNIKFQMMMSKSESEAIDDWRFANRVNTKAEAIRLLIAKALSKETK